MSFIKLGEDISIKPDFIKVADDILSDPDIAIKMSDDSEIISQFKKTANELKQIAPKAKDFLYFMAVAMHSAEAALLDDNGNLKKDSNGNVVTASWEKNGDSLKWICSDPTIKPLKNSNGDIFPRHAVLKAYKKWAGKPLCIDHKSNSVDHVRGVIVDTYYDQAKDRVIALCALDKINYPDLARKVSTGVSSSVSIGVGVGRAICTEDNCHRVARVEADFCDHMKRKNGYGEINDDLNPIELSIVVTGADPKAKIKHIIAAANSIGQYVDMKEKEINKLAEEDETRDISLAKSVSEGLETAQKDLEALKQKVEELKGHEEEEQKEYDQEPSSDTTSSSSDPEIKQALNKIVNKIAELDKKINKLSFKNGEEMADKKVNAWYQGTEEPTPGKTKYPVDPTQDKLRAKDDKQMVGETPFPGVGPVDGMYPGDEQKKRELQRMAEVEQRELRRQAALKLAAQSLNKEGWYQGTEEPTPGKTKYPVDPTQDKLRAKDDKQMVGAPPFPGVGKVDGLYGDDLKTKEKLLRAKLTAKFVKAAKPTGEEDRGESRWNVYSDKNLILTATVNEITGGKANVASIYEAVHSRPFGEELLAKIRTEGFDKVVSLYKGAQALGTTTPPPAAPLPSGLGLPGGDPMADPLATGAEPMPETGGSGSPADEVEHVATELDNLSSDLKEVAKTLKSSGEETAPLNEFAEVAGNTMTETPAGGPVGLPTTATADIMTLIKMQKKLNGYLMQGAKQLYSEIKEHKEHLKLAKVLLSDYKKASPEKREAINDVIKEALDDSRKTLSNGTILKGSFVNYAKATQKVVKRAEKQLGLIKNAQKKPTNELLTGSPFYEGAKQPSAVKPVKVPVAPKSEPTGTAPKMPEKKNPSDMTFDELYAARGATPARDKMLSSVKGPLEKKAPTTTLHTPSVPGMNVAPGTPDQARADDKDHECETDDKEDQNDLKVKKDGEVEGTPEEVGKAMKAKEASYDLNTKEGKKAYLAKLAEKGLNMSNMIGVAHPGGGTTIKFDVKPSNGADKVETVEEVHKVMLDIANAPVKVKKAAEDIQKHVLAGDIKPEDFEMLITAGLDSDAVKYWKAFYGQAKDGGSDFASKMVQDYTNKKVAEEKQAYKVKVARAYALANEMVRKGMLVEASVDNQVEDILKWNDEGYESTKRMVSKMPAVKTASAIPQVGLMHEQGVYVPAPEAEKNDLRIDLDAAFASSGKRGMRF